MSRRVLSADQDIYLRSIAKGKSVQECTTLINEHFGTSFSIGQIKAYKSNHSIISGMSPWEFVDHSKRKITTLEQEAFLHDNYLGIGNKELAEKVNKEFGTHFTSQQMNAYKARNNLDSGLTGCFDKGHIPLNKGQKMSLEQYERVKHTMFKKGNTPANTDPIGTEKLLADGYVWVKINNLPKVAKNLNWRPKHVKIWQDFHGPVPDGHVVIFLDNDRTNFDLDNLKMISQSTNVRMNQNHLRQRDKELTEAGVAVAEVITAMASAKRRMDGKS